MAANKRNLNCGLGNFFATFASFPGYSAHATVSLL
jgi:hypothetical protein